MKTLTFHGPGRVLVVPGHFQLNREESVDVSDHLAEVLLIANPHLELSVTDSIGVEPPRTGKGSGAAAWAVYAATLGITTGGLDRDEIIAAVDAAKTEPDATAAGEPEADTGAGHPENPDQEA